MRMVVMFTLVSATACSSPSAPPTVPTTPPPPTPVDAAIAPVPDAVTLVPRALQRGDACTAEQTCDAGMSCVALLGGYCAGPCELGCGDGACVQTPTLGDVCMKRCDSARDCRTADGYVCDPQWHACLLPNVAAIVPAMCPLAPTTAVQDRSFGPSVKWSGDKLAPYYQAAPAAVVTDDGGIAALYMSLHTLDHGKPLGLTRATVKGEVTFEQSFTPDGTDQFEPSLARDRKGTLYATWFGANVTTGTRLIALSTSTDRGATWSLAAPIQDPADCLEGQRECFGKPMVVVGPDPKKPAADIVYVMYATANAGLRVRASRDRGKTFGPPVTALVGSYGNAIVGSNGTLHVAMLSGTWRDGYGSAQHVLQYTSSTDGGASFRPPVRVSGFEETLPYYFSNPSIAVDTSRKLIYVAYVRGGRDAKWEIMLAISKDGGTTWKRQKLAGDGCAIHMVPNLVLDPTSGALHVAYYDSEGAPGRFVHASCASGGLRCKVLGAINTVPFAALTTARSSRTSIGERASLVLDARRRTLHAVWAQDIDEAGANVSRVFHSSAKLK